MIPDAPVTTPLRLLLAAAVLALLAGCTSFGERIIDPMGGLSEPPAGAVLAEPESATAAITGLSPTRSGIVSSLERAYAAHGLTLPPQGACWTEPPLPRGGEVPRFDFRAWADACYPGGYEGVQPAIDENAGRKITAQTRRVHEMFANSPLLSQLLGGDGRSVDPRTWIVGLAAEVVLWAKEIPTGPTPCPSQWLPGPIPDPAACELLIDAAPPCCWLAPRRDIWTGRWTQQQCAAIGRGSSRRVHPGCVAEVEPDPDDPEPEPDPDPGPIPDPDPGPIPDPVPGPDMAAVLMALEGHGSDVRSRLMALESAIETLQATILLECGRDCAPCPEAEVSECLMPRLFQCRGSLTEIEPGYGFRAPALMLWGGEAP